MFYFILYSVKPDGRLPQIGDNDNGRLHNLNNIMVIISVTLAIF